jgi:hypothetical protein
MRLGCANVERDRLAQEHFEAQAVSIGATLKKSSDVIRN